MGKSKDVKTGSKASKAEVNTLHRVKSGKITKPYNQAPAVTKVTIKEAKPSKKESKKSKKAPTPSESSESESESGESSSSESEEEAKPVKAAAKAEVKTTTSESTDSSSSEDDNASSGSDSDSDKSESGSDSSDSSDSEEETVPAKAVKAAKAVVNGAAKVVAKATVRLHCDRFCKNHMLTFIQESGSDSDSDSDSSESEEVETKKEAESESGSDSSDSDDSEEESTEEAAPSKKRKADDEEETSAKKSKSDDTVEDTGSKNLFVGNLSWNIDDEWLYREFEEFGEITGARVISDRDSGRSKGFGYVEFANSADAAKALAAKKGALIDGREANVDFSTPRDNAAPKDRANARAATYGDQKNPESDTLFVGNISFEANEDIIGEAFGAHGTVVNVRLPTDM